MALLVSAASAALIVSAVACSGVAVDCNSAAECGDKGDAVEKSASFRDQLASSRKRLAYYERGCTFNSTGMTCAKATLERGIMKELEGYASMEASAAVRAEQLSKP